MKKTLLDDGFHRYLVKGTAQVGEPGIPMLMNLHNTTIPRDMIPFSKCRQAKDTHQYVHFYEHDFVWHNLLCNAKRYVPLFQQFDGIITPDCSMLIGQSKCLQQTNTYFNRAVGAYFQRLGIPVIPNIRWSDEQSFAYCFLGVPKNIIVSVSTLGCIQTAEEKRGFQVGLSAMLNELHPTDVLVHGCMPESVFAPFADVTRFHHYQSQIEKAHAKKKVG